jgi:hypothetical protein
LRERIKDIDFWRGAAQIAIMVDHVPGCVLNSVTPINFGFSDAAEGFVFLSGLSAGLAYLPKAHRLGNTAVINACGKRALKLYGVHIGLTLAALAILALAYRATGIEDLAKVPDFALDFGSFGNWLKFFTLQYNLLTLTVLPLYVVLMLWAPIAVALTAWNPRWAIGASVAIYGVARVVGHFLPGFLVGMYFNPLAWQLVFTIGIVRCAALNGGRLQPSISLILLCAAIVLRCAIIMKTDIFGLASSHWSSSLRYKPRLGLGRLAHFIAVAYLIAAASIRFGCFARLVDGFLGRMLQTLGRNSLAVFAAGSLLSTVGRATIVAASEKAAGGALLAVGLAWAVASIALLFLVGLWIDRNTPRRRLQAARVVATERVSHES